MKVPWELEKGPLHLGHWEYYFSAFCLSILPPQAEEVSQVLKTPRLREHLGHIADGCPRTAAH